MPANRSWDSRRKRVYEIVNVGASEDFISRAYDFLNTFAIVINLVVSILYTFQEAREACGELLLGFESATAAFFAADYALRVWTARFLYPRHTEPRALVKYIFSFTGLVICCPSCRTTCPCFSRRERWPSGCSGWCGFSGCSASTGTTTP